MKTEQAFTNSENVPWTRVNDNVSMKLLNGLSNDGPYTAILRSVPRSPDPHRGQYHAVDEEFYCLGGKFTFDGIHWFRRGSYAHFPAHYVHGSRVHVEQGYLLYLRMSGTLTTNFVDKPKSNSPYPLKGTTSLVKPTVFRRVSLTGRNVKTRSDSGLRSRPLQVNLKTGAGTTMLDWGPNGSRRPISLRSNDEIELFFISGQFENGTGETFRQGSYAFLTGKIAEVTLRAMLAGRVLISHGSALNVDVL